MTHKVALDTAVLAAILDSHDKWHAQAIQIYGICVEAEAELVYFDPVINEVISVVARRTMEQKCLDQFDAVLEKLAKQVPVEDITWLSSYTEKWYPEIVELVKEHNGQLNFHDALISTGCQALNIAYIASFDRDFDLIPWVIRLDATNCKILTQAE